MKFDSIKEINDFYLRVDAVSGFVQNVVEGKDAEWMHNNWQSINSCIHILCDPYDVNDDSEMYVKGLQRLSTVNELLGSESFKSINIPSEYSEWIAVLVEDHASKHDLIKCEGHTNGVEFVKYFSLGRC